MWIVRALVTRWWPSVRLCLERMTLRNSSLRAAAALAVFAAVPAWTTTNLGTPPGHPDAFVQGVGVNDRGTAVAIGDEEVGTNKAQQQAFVWQRGKKTPLTYRRARFIEPVEIDESGDVLGQVGTEAVLWRKGVATSLGRFAPNSMTANGAIVVGSTNDRKHAFIWRSGTLTSLPGLGGTGKSAYAVNRFGTVVGSSTLPSGVQHAVVWRGGQVTDLGTVNRLESTATLISASGTIFGSGDTQGDCCASVVLEWKNGQLIDLGDFGAPAAQPIAMNAHGDVLVETETGDQSTIGLRLLHGGRTIPVRVPALGHQHLYGFGLDNQDDVIGYGLTTGRGFLWRNGRATLLPQGLTPVAVAGGWIIASNGLTDRAVLLRLHR
jgi:probable HAF family extracellular repeat protein